MRQEKPPKTDRYFRLAVPELRPQSEGRTCRGGERIAALGIFAEIGYAILIGITIVSESRRRLIAGQRGKVIRFPGLIGKRGWKEIVRRPLLNAVQNGRKGQPEI